jgi:predicted cupin superfamily sugar epimerase
MTVSCVDIQKKFNMQPHPEGGYYVETHRSKFIIKKENLPNFGDEENRDDFNNFTCDHCFSTSILYLLRSNDFSALHRIKNDETWHFYMGGFFYI